MHCRLIGLFGLTEIQISEQRSDKDKATHWHTYSAGPSSHQFVFVMAHQVAVICVFRLVRHTHTHEYNGNSIRRRFVFFSFFFFHSIHIHRWHSERQRLSRWVCGEGESVVNQIRKIEAYWAATRKELKAKNRNQMWFVIWKLVDAEMELREREWCLCLPP